MQHMSERPLNAFIYNQPAHPNALQGLLAPYGHTIVLAWWVVWIVMCCLIAERVLRSYVAHIRAHHSR